MSFCLPEPGNSISVSVILKAGKVEKCLEYFLPDHAFDTSLIRMENGAYYLLTIKRYCVTTDFFSEFDCNKFTEKTIIS